jgi:hypothetical protein
MLKEHNPRPDAPKPIEDPKPAEDAKPTPPWGDDFDPARAWSAIQAGRETERALKARIADFEKAEQEKADADKSDLDKATARADRAEAALKAAQRDALIAKAGIPDELAEFITAEDADGIAAQLAKIKAAIGNADSGDDGAGEDGKHDGRPKPALTPGHGGDDPKPFNVDDVYAAVRAGD